MIDFKYWSTIVKKFWFIIVYEWNAKIDFYDEVGYWPGEEALEMIHTQCETAWKQKQENSRLNIKKMD